MKTVGTLITMVVALFLASPPAFAYVVTLNTWNTSQLQSSGDTIDVSINGTSVTFTFVAGSPGLTNTFQAMQNIAFQPAAFGSGNTLNSASSPYTLSCGTNGPATSSSTGTCQEDGFLVNPAIVEYSTPNGGPGNPTTATFTFANALPAGLTASAFDVHVTFSGNCSGWVDGTLQGSPDSNTNCTTGTPVPEPMTVFLGGTGLLVMGYFARKRLFGAGRRSLAV